MELQENYNVYNSSPAKISHVIGEVSRNIKCDDTTHPQHAEIGNIQIPDGRPPNPIQKPRRSLKKCLTALFIGVILCVLLSAAAVVISLFNLVKSSDQPADPVKPTSPLSPTPAECQSAVNFTSAWRLDHAGRAIRPRNDYANCDTIRLNMAGQPWFRFTGYAGNRLLNTCPSTNGSCGTHGAIWSDDEMPEDVGIPKVASAYGSWANNCKDFTYLISVILCSSTPHDYIYKYDGDDSCDRGFCGMF